MQFLRDTILRCHRKATSSSSTNRKNSQYVSSVSDCSIISLNPVRNKQPLSNDAHHAVIVWFEPTYSVRNDFQQTFDKLNAVCYKVIVVMNIDKCIESLIKIGSDSKAFLLMPGMWAVDMINNIQRSSIWNSIDKIFIYSFSPQQYDFLRREYSYIQKIYANIEEVGNAIHQSVDKRCEVLRFYDQRNVRNLSYEDTTVAFIWFIVFKIALLQLPRDNKAKDDMLDLCRRFYMTNNAQLAFINEFKDTYRLEDAPKWFSRSSLLYKLINRALRTQDVEQLYIFRYFIRDLSSWLSREFGNIARCKEKFSLYRGTALSQDDFRLLARGKLLAPNGFFSTTRDIKVAKLFIGSSRPETVRVLYEISCDMTSYSPDEINELVAFADISSHSHMPDEQEVLFDLGATFEIEEIEPYSPENNCFLIHLIPSCEGTHISRDYIQNCQNESGSISAALTFGALLIKTGKYTVVQHYFEQLLNDPNNENLSDIYHYLGWAHLGQGDYGRAIANFERAHDLTLTNDDISKARLLNSIGKALVAKGLIKEPLIYYERALKLRIACLGNEHEDVADSYTNVGRMHYLAGNYQLALEYYEKSIQTNTNAVESVHDSRINETTEELDSMKCSGSISDFGDDLYNSSKCDSISHSLYEMGSVQWKLGESSSGLNNMIQSLTLDKHSSSHSASEFRDSIHSRGNVDPLIDRDIKEIIYRLRCLRHARKNPSKSGIEITEALENVGYAYGANGKFDAALRYYLSALKRREKQRKDSIDSLQLARTMNCIGDMHDALHQFEQALNYYKQALTIYEMFPSEANRNRLRTMEKLDRIAREIPIETGTFTIGENSMNRTASTSAYLDKKQNTNHQRSRSLSPSVFFLRHNISSASD